MARSSFPISKIIAASQLFGALATGYMLVHEIYKSIEKQDMLTDAVLILTPFCLFFIALGSIAGWLLWQNKKSGYWLSSALQFFQIFFFATIPLTYLYAAGVFVVFKYTTGGDFAISANYGANLDFYINNVNETATFGINLVALFFFIYLLNGLQKKYYLNN